MKQRIHLQLEELRDKEKLFVAYNLEATKWAAKIIGEFIHITEEFLEKVYNPLSDSDKLKAAELDHDFIRPTTDYTLFGSYNGRIALYRYNASTKKWEHWYK